MSRDNAPMLVEKSWDEFRETGLVVLINKILHVFGWTMTFDINDDGNVLRAYPSRTKFRGFSKQTSDESYKRISKYMVENAETLLKDCEE